MQDNARIDGAMDVGNSRVFGTITCTGEIVGGVFDENGNDISDNPNHIGNLNPYRYRGYYYDRETNLYYLGYRYYSPTLHRFISTDCATYDDIVGGNLYVYCNNNPVIKVDDNGKVPFAAIVIVGGILNAAAKCMGNGRKETFREKMYYFATGAVGAAIGVINPLLGLSLTSLADSSYIVAKERIESYKKQKNKQNKITFKRRTIETAEDIGKILQSLVTDVVTNKCASKVVNNTIPRSRGREAKYFISQFFYKKAQNFYLREGLGALIETGISSLADRIIGNCEKYPVSNKVIDINSPLYQPYDNRFYIVNTEE